MNMCKIIEIHNIRCNAERKGNRVKEHSNLPLDGSTSILYRDLALLSELLVDNLLSKANEEE